MFDPTNELVKPGETFAAFGRSKVGRAAGET
jgi:hypothetical protein